MQQIELPLNRTESWQKPIALPASLPEHLESEAQQLADELEQLLDNYCSDLNQSIENYVEEILSDDSDYLGNYSILLSEGMEVEENAETLREELFNYSWYSSITDERFIELLNEMISWDSSSYIISSEYMVKKDFTIAAFCNDEIELFNLSDLEQNFPLPIPDKQTVIDHFNQWQDYYINDDGYIYDFESGRYICFSLSSSGIADLRKAMREEVVKNLSQN